MGADKIRQSEFMAENGILPIHIKGIRDENLSPKEWWKEGTAIYWTPGAAARVKAILDGHQPQAPQADAQNESGYIKMACRSPKSQTDEQDQEGQPGFQVPDEAPLPLLEVPTREDAQPDTEPAGGDPGPNGTPEAQAEAPLTVRVLKRARNYRFVYASLDGERIAVFCPKKGRREIVGKNVRVTKSTVDGETRYTLIP